MHEDDLLLSFSKSGETEELLVMLPHAKACGARSVAITQERSSTLGRHSDLVLELGRIDEAGPHGLAPSASTTAMLALGDALALVVQEGRNFGPEQFARFHPGGDLGRRLMKVGELMRAGEWRTYAPDQEVVKEGELDDRFYIIVSGNVDVRSGGRTVGGMTGGECFGETSYVTDATRAASIVARDEVTLLRLSSTLLETLSTSCQLRFNRMFLRSLISRLQGGGSPAD